MNKANDNVYTKWLEAVNKKGISPIILLNIINNIKDKIKYRKYSFLFIIIDNISV
jgi:hypothetical protein